MAKRSARSPSPVGEALSHATRRGLRWGSALGFMEISVHALQETSRCSDLFSAQLNKRLEILAQSLRRAEADMWLEETQHFDALAKMTSHKDMHRVKKK